MPFVSRMHIAPLGTSHAFLFCVLVYYYVEECLEAMGAVSTRHARAHRCHLVVAVPRGSILELPLASLLHLSRD